MENVMHAQTVSYFSASTLPLNWQPGLYQSLILWGLTTVMQKYSETVSINIEHMVNFALN